MGRILDYKGFAVVVDEPSGVFFAYSIDHTTHTYGPDEIAEASNLPNLKSKLDQISKGNLGQTCLILTRYWSYGARACEVLFHVRSSSCS